MEFSYSSEVLQTESILNPAFDRGDAELKSIRSWKGGLFVEFHHVDGGWVSGSHFGLVHDRHGDCTYLK